MLLLLLLGLAGTAEGAPSSIGTTVTVGAAWSLPQLLAALAALGVTVATHCIGALLSGGASACEAASPPTARRARVTRAAAAAV